MAVKIEYHDMPHMKPVPMETKSKGLLGGVWLWIATSRKWEIVADWKFHITHDGNTHPTYYTVPKGFIFDGASVPKFARSWLSPMGVLLSGGLVHDYVYKFEVLRLGGKKGATEKKSQKWADELFRDICIDVNGFKVINYLAYYALRLGGFMAWNGHRKRNIKWDA
jgi:hypothetical protein|tara:strand:- start:163 stop:660 length:498 start_codon:yes stop_codon:yes gene_type:complete